LESPGGPQHREKGRATERLFSQIIYDILEKDFFALGTIGKMYNIKTGKNRREV